MKPSREPDVREPSRLAARRHKSHGFSPAFLGAVLIALFRGVANATCPGPESCCVGDGSFNEGCVNSVCFRQSTDMGNLPTTCENSGSQCNPTSCVPSIDRLGFSVSADSDLSSAINAEIRVWSSASSEWPRGTVLFVSGADGLAFLSDKSMGNAQMMNELAGIGFTVIDLKWNASWKGTDYGNRLEASQFATLLKYLHYQYVACGQRPFIVVGNSSGAGEVAYALTTYGAESYIDLAILSAGPPEARLDLECTHESNPCIATWCNTLFCSYEPTIFQGVQWSGMDMCDLTSDPNRCTDFRPPCVFDTDTNENEPTCGNYIQGKENTTACDPNDNPDEENYLLENSVLWSAAADTLNDFPRTTVHTILGTMDDTQGPVGGLSFYDRLDSRKRLWYIQNGNHDWFDGSTNGRRALKFAIEYFSRAWVGDTDYHGETNTSDYRRIKASVEAGGTTNTCPTPPNPDTTVEYDLDANNDGNVDSADVNYVAVIASCSGNSQTGTCSTPVTLKKCAAPASTVLNLEQYPPPSAGVDCSGSASPGCGLACAFCTP